MSNRQHALDTLIALAERQLSLLDADDVDGFARESLRYDAAFQTLETIITRDPFVAADSERLARLAHLHRRLLDRTLELRDSARLELADIAQARSVLSYAPAGESRAPRYLDESA